MLASPLAPGAVKTWSKDNQEATVSTCIDDGRPLLAFNPTDSP